MMRDLVYASQHLAGRVTRYHTWPTLTQQTVAEHCWRVAGIYVEIFGLPRAEVLYYMMHHDSGELLAGDLPFPLKIKYPGLKIPHEQAEEAGLEMLGIVLPELTAEEKLRCKLCDLLEMHEYGSMEFQMGNSYAAPIVQDTYAAVAKLTAAFQREQYAIMLWLRRRDE